MIFIVIYNNKKFVCKLMMFYNLPYRFVRIKALSFDIPSLNRFSKKEKMLCGIIKENNIGKEYPLYIK